MSQRLEIWLVGTLYNEYLNGRIKFQKNLFCWCQGGVGGMGRSVVWGARWYGALGGLGRSLLLGDRFYGAHGGMGRSVMLGDQKGNSSGVHSTPGPYKVPTCLDKMPIKND